MQALANVLQKQQECMQKGMSKGAGKGPKNKFMDLMRCTNMLHLRLLDLGCRLCASCRWGIAYDRFAVASAIVEGQLTYSEALAHKANCLEVGLRAGNVGRNTVMTVLYDEVSRNVFHTWPFSKCMFLRFWVAQEDMG